MRSIAVSLSLILAAAILFAVFAFVEIGSEAGGDTMFEPSPTADAAGDHPPGRVDADATRRTVGRADDGGPAGVPGPADPRSAPERAALAAAAERAARELDVERAKTAALTGELASAKRAAEGERAAARLQLDDERARSADLLRDLGQARDRIARTFRDRLLEIGRRDSTDEARVGERIRHAASPGTGDGALPAAVQLGLGLHPADPAGDAADRGGAADVGAVTPPSPDPAEAAWASLPGSAGAHVTVAYARGSEPARRRAVALSQALQAEGIDVAEPVDAPSPAKGGRVTYYYGTDRASAERVAGLCDAPAPVHGRLPPHGRLPRPGTIGIAVAD